MLVRCRPFCLYDVLLSSIGLVTLADNNERQTKALVPILTATPNVSDIHFPTGTKFLRLTKKLSIHRYEYE